jgi:trehalose-phosphatase
MADMRSIDQGADIVVTDQRDGDVAGESHAHGTPALTGREGPAAGRSGRPLHAVDHVGDIVALLGGRRVALFLDYDGTLTPIVRRPEDARLTDAMRSRLRALSSLSFVAIVSGRDLDDVRSMVGLDDLHYAGSHGFDIAGPGGLRMQQEAAVSRLPELDAAEEALRHGLERIDGVWVERKRFALAVHFREADDADEARVEDVVDRVLAQRSQLRKRGGKKIFELQPDVPWHKGRAVLWLMGELGLDRPDVLPVYVGDDVTDEDAFSALDGRGLGIRVGPPDEPTSAGYFVHDTGELERFLQVLTERLDPNAHVHG